jgi:tetratricopeptide (TPR) repeat protein
VYVTFVADPTEDDFYAAADHALACGDMALALEQIGAALSFDPLSARNLALLDAIVARAHRPLDLLERKGEKFFGAMAVRAWVLAKNGRVGAAIAELFEVVAFRPSVPYLAWSRAWVEAAPSLRGLRADEVLAGAAKLALAIAPGDRSAERNVSCAVWLLERVARERPAARVGATVAASQLARAIGQTELAEAKLREALGAGAGVTARVELAALLRQIGRLDDAIAEIDTVLAGGTVDAALRVDRAVFLCEAERVDAAASEVEAARKAADAAESLASTLDACEAFVRARRDPRDAEALAALVRVADARAPRSPASDLAVRSSVYRTVVPPLQGDLPAVVRSALFRAARERPAGAVRLRIRGDVRAPASAVLALRAGLCELGLEGGIEGAAQPAAADREPAAESSAVVADIVRGPVDVDAWSSPAGLRLEREEIERLLASPPAPVCGRDPVDRLHLVQIAVLAMLGRAIEHGDEPALDRLVDIAAGDDDWLAAAGLAVLGAVARRAPERVGPRAVSAFESVAAALGASDPRRAPLVAAWLSSGTLRTDADRARVAALGQGAR